MPNFIPTDEQWEKMKRHIKGDRFKKEDFFVFETRAVGDKIVPNRYMRLTPALLQVMRDDAEKGVSLMLNHNWSQLGVQSIPIGKVFDGRISTSSQDGENTTLYTTQYILRDDSKVDGYSKNDIINLIESGIIADTSVGWGTTRESYKCSICGCSIYDFENCKHLPGNKYIVNESTNEVRECIIEAEPPKDLHVGNNVLMENSVVFDGAYPNAVIQSSMGEKIETPNGVYKQLNGKVGLSNKDLIVGYSTGNGINLLYKQSEEKGGVENMKLENEEVTEMESEVTEEVKEETTTTTENTEEVVEEVTENAEGETVETQEQAQETENNEEAEEVEETEESEEEAEEKPEEVEEEKLYVSKELIKEFGADASMDQILQLAKEGLEMRNEVISSALESGVHSMGNAFNKDIFTKTFSNMKTKDIKEMANAWEQQAKDLFSKEKVSKQDFSNDAANAESVVKINFNQFKTGI